MKKKYDDKKVKSTPWTRLTALILLTAMLLSLTACGQAQEPTTVQAVTGSAQGTTAAEQEASEVPASEIPTTMEPEKSTMFAAVTEISGDTAYICPDEDQWERSSGDKIFFSMAWFTGEQAAQVQVGTRLKIEYDGYLMETYPLQINEPYSIEILGSPEETTKGAEEPATTPDGKPAIVEIIDHGASVDTVVEVFAREGVYRYCFSSPHSERLEVVLANGETIPFNEAMEQGYDVISQLTRQGIGYSIMTEPREEEAAENDPVDSRLAEAVLGCNGTGDPEVIRLEAHQPIARMAAEDGSGMVWYLTYIYQEYEQDGDTLRLHYENRSAMMATLADDAADSTKKVLTAVEDLTGPDYEQRVTESFPKSIFAMNGAWFFGDLYPDVSSQLRYKLKKLAGELPYWEDKDESFIDIRRSFALRLFQEAVKEKPGENVLVAPLSVQLALAMTANGAKGETLRQMEDVICGGRSIYELNTWFCNYQAGLDNPEEGKVTVANSIWVRQDRAQGMKKDYLHRIAGCFDAGMNSGLFDESMVKRINDWVNESTEGMIPEIVQRLEKDDAVLLINALTFDAKWYRPFMNDGLQKGAFTALDGAPQDAEMMSSKEIDCYLEGDRVEGFHKEYEGGRYSLAVLVPEESVDLYEYIASLTPESLERLLHPWGGDVSITMPKFSAKSDMELSEALKNMGITRAFDGFAAEFGAMTDVPDLAIDRVLHKTFIDVTEEGTRAGAATAVVLEDSLPEHSVKVDRPFIYMIMDTYWGAPIFMGVVTDLIAD